MSVRSRLEMLIRERLTGMSPQLAGDWWGRYRLTVSFPTLAIGQAGPVSGQAEAVLWAERFDDLPMEAVVSALREAMHDPGPELPQLRARLIAYREEALEMAVAARLGFEINLLYKE